MGWEADVYQGDRLAARIERTATGSRLEFDPQFLESAPQFPGKLCQLIPYSLQPKQEVGDNLHPFFLNLMPEGARLDALLSSYRIARDDFLGLLIKVGWDTIGDIAVVPHGHIPHQKTDQRLIQPDQMDFASLLTDGPNPPTSDAAIPGVQDKLSSAMFAMPVSTQKWPAAILKLTPRRYPRLVENEGVFQRMAKDCDLYSCESKLVSDSRGEAGLLVKRFDRVQVKGTRVREKLHVEDACQLLGQVPANKYHLTLQDIAKAFKETCTAPVNEIRRLIQLYAYAYMIGNTDLHGKNVSLLWRKGVIVMAPAYDLPSSLPYPELDRHMALKMDGRDDAFKAQHFFDFGQRFAVSPRAVRSDLEHMAAGATPWLERLGEIGFPDDVTAKLRDEIQRRRDRINP